MLETTLFGILAATVNPTGENLDEPRQSGWGYRP